LWSTSLELTLAPGFFSTFSTFSPIVGLGIFAGLVWTRRTGWSCGGIITPGLLALYASSPVRVASVLALGVVLTPLLSLCAGAWSLYGRERVGAAMLLALFAQTALSLVTPFHGVGWVIAGLVAADADRQGVVMTLCGVISCTLFTVFCLTLFRTLGMMLWRATLL
jgi:hypothetical protein